MKPGFISKKRLVTGRRRFEKDLFFGRKNFRYLQEGTNRMLQRAYSYWQKKDKPLTEQDYKDRELMLKITELATSFYSRIKEAKAYRAGIKFRNCTYKKYFDKKKNRIIFACSFYKIIEKKYRTNYLILNIGNKTKEDLYKAKLIKDKLNFADLKVIEEGKFRFSPIFMNEFNNHFYPSGGKKYSYKFIGKSNNTLLAQLIL